MPRRSPATLVLSNLVDRVTSHGTRPQKLDARFGHLPTSLTKWFSIPRGELTAGVGHRDLCCSAMVGLQMASRQKCSKFRDFIDGGGKPFARSGLDLSRFTLLILAPEVGVTLRKLLILRRLHEIE